MSDIIVFLSSPVARGTGGPLMSLLMRSGDRAKRHGAPVSNNIADNTAVAVVGVIIFVLQRVSVRIRPPI